ncbi:MAG: DUF4405 domain-containing protein [Thermodesulfobacteriota bacterium]
MPRREFNLLLDWILFVAALMTFSTGLVLLLCFHMGHGALTISALGQSKLFWFNLHRLSAAVMTTGAVTHVGLHWRAFRGTLTNVVTRRRRRPINSELTMYTALFIAALTGFVAWLVLEGSSPLFGPAFIGRASSTRHPWIDTHHTASLLSFLLIVHHVGHRWRFMVRRARPGAVARKDAKREPK